MDKIPTGFLEKMPLVRVLDLSHNYSLKSCWEVDKLVNLENILICHLQVYVQCCLLFFKD